MREPTVAVYQKKLSQDVPPDLEKLITTKGEKTSYLRRGHTNVVFRTDLALGVNPARAERRAKAAEAAKAMGPRTPRVPQRQQARQQAAQPARQQQPLEVTGGALAPGARSLQRNRV